MLHHIDTHHSYPTVYSTKPTQGNSILINDIYYVNLTPTQAIIS